jgi:perosamine synthetase
MKRTLPPAGHRILLRSILRAATNRTDASRFLKKMNMNAPTVFLSSGTAALTFSLSALKKRYAKKEVILPAYSCPSVLAAVVKAGLVPVLCDLRPGCFQMDPDHLLSNLGPATLAVIAVHLFGIPENVSVIKRIVEGKGVFLVENAAQAFGNRFPIECQPPESRNRPDPGIPLGTVGDIGIFSFGRGKPFTLLTGGALAINNPELRRTLEDGYECLTAGGQNRFLKYLLNLFLYSIFFRPRLFSIPQGIPALKLGETIFSLDFMVERMSPAALTLGSDLFDYFLEIRKRRLALTAEYIACLKEFREEFYYLPDFLGEEVVLLRFPLVLHDSAKKIRILRELKEAGVGATGMYPVSLDQQDGVQPYLNCKKTFPVGGIVAGGMLTLPLHEFVEAGDVELVYRVFKNNT